MKKKICMVPIVVLILVSTVFGATWSTNIIGGSTIYEESKFAPLVFLSTEGGRVLIDDPYGPFNNGDVTQRASSYVFTGEKIVWKVLVWDKNGAPEKLKDVHAGWATQNNGPIDPEAWVNCQPTTQPRDGISLSNIGYPNVRRPGDQEDQTNFNARTMEEYECRLTIVNSCEGPKWMGVKAIDMDNLTGTMTEAEAWYCNPSININVSGDINFGELGPGEQGSSTISIKNVPNGDGGGVEVVFAIAGTDFYSPSANQGLCPNTNALQLQGDGTSFTTGFWYSATQGINQVGPKRIPYGDMIVDADPILSSGNGLIPNYSPLVTTNPGGTMSMTLHLGIPQPCNGAFTDGDITLFAWAK